MSSTVTIAGRAIGAGAGVYVIAEVGVNHDGNLERGLALVDAAAEAGADAVKFQTFDPSALAAAGAPLAEYQHRGARDARDQGEMLEKLALSADDFVGLSRRCAERGVQFLSSPFDERSAELLIKIGVPAIKVGSGELTNTPFLERLAGFGVPVLLSTGMSDLFEIEAALVAIDAGGAPPVVLLHCVSSYPTPPDQANLRAIATLREHFDLPTGYSDHCLGLDVSLAAVALGAVVLERHVTLDRAAPGPDHAISLLPSELAELIRRARVVEAALGDGHKVPQPTEAEVRRVARRSLVAARALRRGERIDERAVVAKRPGGGLAPALRSRIVGSTARRDVAADAPFTDDDLPPLGGAA